MMAEIPVDGTVYSISFKHTTSGEVLNRSFTAKAPDDAVGKATDYHCEQLGFVIESLETREIELDVERFNDQYRLIAIMVESQPEEKKKAAPADRKKKKPKADPFDFGELEGKENEQADD